MDALVWDVRGIKSATLRLKLQLKIDFLHSKKTKNPNCAQSADFKLFKNMKMKNFQVILLHKYNFKKINLMESGQIQCIWLTYIQFIPSMFSLIVWLNKPLILYSSEIFHLHLTQNYWCIQMERNSVFIYQN